MLLLDQKNDFLTRGYTKEDQLLTPDEVSVIRNWYDELLQDQEATQGLRSDLAGDTGTKSVERITQIMRPSLVLPKLAKHPVYQRALQLAKELLGTDMALDFDMLINKAPFTDTPTPLHQDAAYWIQLPDHRAVSCWIALDEVFAENGCMWFVPRTIGTNVFRHQALPGGGALFCEADISSAQCVPLPAGGCTLHDGFTLHFSYGNTTAGHRRALILNFRPEAMIKLERAQGVDHTGDRKVRNSGR